jgi:hypothetical protein
MNYNENPPIDIRLKQTLDEMTLLYMENIFSREANYAVLYRDVPQWEAEDAYMAILEIDDNIAQIKLFFKDLKKG